MKKIMLIALCIVLFSGVACAQPFIAADPQTDASKYRMRLKVQNQIVWGEWVEAPPLDNHLWFDIGGVPTGNFDGEAQAGAQWELTDMTGMITSTVDAWSASAPFVLKVKRGSAPTKLKTVPSQAAYSPQ